MEPQYRELFRDIDISSITYLLDECDEIWVDAGATLLAEGAYNDSIYVVLDGELQVRIGATNAALLLCLGVGACVGERSILSWLNVSAYVVVAHASRLFVIREEELWSLNGRSHEFACNLLKILSGRVRDDNNRLQISLRAQQQFERASGVDTLPITPCMQPSTADVTAP